MLNDSKKPENETPGWYALKVFYNRTEAVLDEIRNLVRDCYVPGRIVASLMFVFTTPSDLELIRRDRYERLKVYTHPGTREACRIPEKEMEIFRFVTGIDDKKMTLVDPDALHFKKGEKVRVTDGIFKGAEGYVMRIKGNKRLVVSIQGVAAVATSYIPSAYLEKMENDS